jgi:hypothetical protein
LTKGVRGIFLYSPLIKGVRGIFTLIITNKISIPLLDKEGAGGGQKSFHFPFYILIIYKNNYIFILKRSF